MIDESGIFEEIAAEASFKGSSPGRKRELISLENSPFFSLEEGKGKLVISGIALAEGVWKNVLYPAEEIAKAAERLKGKPLKVEHGMDEDFKDKSVGRVIDAYYDKTLKSLIFKAEVTDPEAIEKVKNGEFQAVSCSTWIDKLPVNQEQSVGFNFLFNELSLVRSPACDKCFIFAVEELSKKLKENLNISPVKEESGEESMDEAREAPVEEEVTEELTDIEFEGEVDLTEVEPPKLFAVIECSSLDELMELAKKKTIVTYYYGYPYPYPYYGKYPYPHYPYYPYYPYPYKKPEKRAPKKTKAKKSLWAVVELESPEEIAELRKAKKVVAVYYGYYGYPYYGYPYYGYKYYGYPYYPYPYYGKYPALKSEEEKSEEKEEEDSERKKLEMSEEELLDVLELAEDYRAFMKKCMKEKTDIEDVGERMKACAEEWKKKASQEQREEGYPAPEEKAGPRTDEERAKAHFGISDEEWEKMTEEEIEEYYEE